MRITGGEAESGEGWETECVETECVWGGRESRWKGRSRGVWLEAGKVGWIGLLQWHRAHFRGKPELLLALKEVGGAGGGVAGSG